MDSLAQLKATLAEVKQKCPIGTKMMTGQKFIVTGQNQTPDGPTGPVDSPEMMDHYFGAKKGAAETRAKFAAAEAKREAAEQAKRQRIRDGIARMFDAGIVQ